MSVVLVVNDDRDMLDMYGAVLEEMGHRPLLRIDLNPEPETVIAARAEAVIIDLQAEQDRRAGLHAIEALRAHPATHELPIILATAAVDDVSPLAERLDHLDVPILIKPFAIDKLRDLLGRVLPYPPTAD
jgi:DNA-binding NtrC family response regulator